MSVNSERMIARRIRRLHSAGFTTAELTVVIGIIGALMALSVPLVYTYFSASTLTAGAEELSAILVRARQLAIRQNSYVCVTNNGTNLQYHVGTCGAAAWIGPGTDGAGWITLTNNVTISNGQNVCFDYFGSSPATAPAPCTAGGTLTVTNQANGRTMSVIVARTGRVTTGP